MSQFKILAVPPGQAPLEIRQEWVGMTLPVADLPPGTVTVSVLSGERENREDDEYYSVETTVAIQELRKKSPAAARWWEATIPATMRTWLSFSRDVCQFVP